MLGMLRSLLVVACIVCAVATKRAPSVHLKSLKRNGGHSMVPERMETTQWSPSSWQDLPVKQAPDYPDQVNMFVS